MEHQDGEELCALARSLSRARVRPRALSLSRALVCALARSLSRTRVFSLFAREVDGCPLLHTSPTTPASPPFCCHLTCYAHAVCMTCLQVIDYLLSRSKLLILDEAFDGLDAASRAELTAAVDAALTSNTATATSTTTSTS